MHARKDRRILEEKRHGGCAEARERTAAQRETVSGRKGPQARAIAFSGHDPRRTRRAQHGIFGERSFCRLRYLAWDWTQYPIRPDRFGWPVIRKPLHGPFKGCGVQIAIAISYAIKCRATIQNDSRDTLPSYAARLSERIGYDNEL